VFIVLVVVLDAAYFSPSVFDLSMNLIFAKTPRFATSVLLTSLFEGEDDDDENDM
jgi:hypothetical protein